MTSLFYSRIHTNSSKLMRISIEKLFETGVPSSISIKSINDLSIYCVKTKFLDNSTESPYIDCISYFSQDHFFVYIEYRIKKSEMTMDEYSIKDAKIDVYYIGTEKGEISFHKEGVINCSIDFH